MSELYRSDILDVDIGKSLNRMYVGVVLATGDNRANRFGANVYRGGEAVPLDSCGVLGYFIRPNMETVVLKGAASGNTAYVDLEQACYAYEGTFSLAIKVSADGATHTVRIIDGYIRQTTTDTLIDPGTVVPSLDELFAQIAAMEAATAEATTAAAAANEAREGIQGDLAALTQEIGDVASGVVYGAENAVSGNLMPFASDILDGSYYSVADGKIKKQTNKNFYAFILRVNQNSVYTCTFYRFCVLLAGDKETAIGDMLSSNVTINTGDAEYVAVSFDKTQYDVDSYVISQGLERDANAPKVRIPWLAPTNTPETETMYNAFRTLPSGVMAEAYDAAKNAPLMLADYENCVKYNKTTVYMAKFADTVGNISIYHGSGTYQSYLKVTPSTIVVNTNGAEVYNQAHGLTIADYLFIAINTDAEDKAAIRVMSGGKIANLADVQWTGWRGQIFALSSTALTYHKMVWTCRDFDCPLWVFGDSYLSKTSQERWGYYLTEMGYDKWLACGFPGATSKNVIANVSNLFAIARPKYALWCLGMNDPDNGAVNADWLAAAQSFVVSCEKHNVTPVFAKIPNAHGNGDMHDSSYKNAWIDAGGYRYIDFPAAVGADASGYWYTDLLATDGIHPSWRGAQALAMQVLMDVPEIMQ